jgi:hypothetical protein
VVAHEGVAAYFVALLIKRRDKIIDLPGKRRLNCSLPVDLGDFLGDQLDFPDINCDFRISRLGSDLGHTILAAAFILERAPSLFRFPKTTSPPDFKNSVKAPPLLV